MVFIETLVFTKQVAEVLTDEHWRVTESQIMMLTMYAKNEQTNLTAAQVKQLAKLVESR